MQIYSGIKGCNCNSKNQSAGTEGSQISSSQDLLSQDLRHDLYLASTS